MSIYRLNYEDGSHVDVDASGTEGVLALAEQVRPGAELRSVTSPEGGITDVTELAAATWDPEPERW